MKPRHVRHLMAAALSLMLPWTEANGAALNGPTIEWLQQVGSARHDEGFEIAADFLGSVFVTGRTSGNWESPLVGTQDGFIRKYDSTGGLQWARQFGVAGDSLWSYGVAPDLFGNVYVGGHTRGDLGGQVGDLDLFVGKYDSSGNRLWLRQFGTKFLELGIGVAADSVGNVYLTGYTVGSLGGPNAGERDAYVTKFDSSGSLQWTRQIGTTANDEASGVAVDRFDNVIITGHTQGSLAGPHAGGNDIFVSKFDGSGALLWTRQAGTPSIEDSSSVATDNEGNIYLSGLTGGNFARRNLGSGDGFLSKYDPLGNPIWARQFGTSSADNSLGVSVGDGGQVYVTGFTRGPIDGPPVGSDDVFLARYDPSGNPVWFRQLGTVADEVSNGVSANIGGTVYITGYTQGSLVSPNPGGGDVFVAKFSEVPEPTTLLITVATAILWPLLCSRGRE